MAADDMNFRRVLIVAQTPNFVLKPELMDRIFVRDTEFEFIYVYGSAEVREFALKQGVPHLVLAQMMPGSESQQIIRAVNELHPLVPLISVGPNNEALKAFALTRSDDYILTEYIDPAMGGSGEKELARRMTNVLSRMANFSYSQGILKTLRVGVEIDFGNRVVYKNGEAVDRLTKHEAKLAKFLVDHPGVELTAEAIIKHVWGGGQIKEDRNALRVHMHRLRDKLEIDPEDPTMFVTVRGVGYVYYPPMPSRK